jgi:hypothetical protein
MSLFKAKGNANLTMKVTRADGTVEEHQANRKIGFFERVAMRQKMNRNKGKK